MKLLIKNKNSHAMIALVLIIALSMFPTASIFAATYYTISQDVTAYISASGAKTHSGKSPYQGSCAVHPRRESDVIVPGNSPGQFPFGTTAVLSESVPMYPGNTYRSVFTVEDTGDYNFNLSRSFIDVWQGTDVTGGTIWSWCINTFGIRTANITFITQ